MNAALLLVALPALAETGEVNCAETWDGINPPEVTAYANGEVTFRVVVASRCRHEIECEWRLDRGAGQLSDTSGNSVIWTGPPEPPEDCIPDYYRVYASCRFNGRNPHQGQADLTLRCTQEEWGALKAANEEATLEGGGCGSAQPAPLAMLLPLGLWRRRPRRPSRP